jgi:lysophospholipase L1-like esterase
MLVARSGPSVPEPPGRDLDESIGAPGGRAVRVVWLGDSTAAGVGASKPDGSLARQVASKLVSLHPAVRFDVHVLAVSGATVADVVARQLPGLGGTADLVLVSVGANDTTHLVGRSSFRSRYGRLLSSLGDAGIPASHVILLGVPDLGSAPRLPQPLRAVVGWRGRMLDADVRHLAKARGAVYVDIFAHTSSAFRHHPGRYFAKDHYHPNDAGYGLWAEAVAPVVPVTA